MKTRKTFSEKNRIKEMALLYANFKETINAINQELTKEKSQPLKYYLLPKDWLEEYKMINKYETVTSQINFYLMKDYPTFKSLLEDENSFNSNFNNISLPDVSEAIHPPFLNEPLNLSNYNGDNVYFLENFIPIKSEIIEQYSSLNFDFDNKDVFLYHIIIGEGNIFVIDNRNPLNIFICAYDKKQEYFVPKSLLSFKNEIYLSEMIDYVVENHGINNYYNEKKIYINNENEQEIKNNKGEKIGFFCNLRKSRISNKDKILNNDSINNIGFMDSVMVPNNYSKNPDISYNINISNNYPKEDDFEEDNTSKNNDINNNNNIIKNSSNIFNNISNNDFNNMSNNNFNNESYNNFNKASINNLTQNSNSMNYNNESINNKFNNHGDNNNFDNNSNNINLNKNYSNNSQVFNFSNNDSCNISNNNSNNNFNNKSNNKINNDSCNKFNNESNNNFNNKR